mgnify:CR=1 FL=1
MKRLLACFLSLLPAAQAVAHPHVFVDTTLRVVLDDNQRVTGIELHWAYDEFFTLMLLEDMGLDPDGDGVLTEDELAILQGFELDNWPEDFEGDIYLYGDGSKLALGTPEPRGVTVEDGPDWWIVEGRGHGGVTGGAEGQSHLDHRIAMAFLILGMASTRPVTVDDGGPIATSFPIFEPLMSRLGAQIERL